MFSGDKICRFACIDCRIHNNLQAIQTMTCVNSDSGLLPFRSCTSTKYEIRLVAKRRHTHISDLDETTVETKAKSQTNPRHGKPVMFDRHHAY